MTEPASDERAFVDDLEPLDDVYLLGARSSPAFRQVMKRAHRAIVESSRRFARVSDLLQALFNRVGTLEDAAVALNGRVIDLEAAAYRAKLVAELPANAPPGTLMVTPGDPFLYVGTGPNTPLRRIATQALP